MTVKKKVIIYVVKGENLLVFRHVDFSYEEVGIQVPAGTIKDGEEPEKAALRELQEETGQEGFRILSFVGNTTYDMRPNKDEIHERYFYLSEPTQSLPERWNSQEKDDGDQAPTNFECFWIPLKNAHILQSGQGALLGKLF